MKNKSLIQSLFILSLTILLLITSTFAWMTYDSNAKSEPVIMKSGKLDVDVLFEVNKNNGDFKEINNQSHMEEIFTNSLPNDRYTFRLTITNKSTSNIKLDLLMTGVGSENGNPDYDLLDVYMMLDGNIKIIRNYEEAKYINFERIDENRDYYISNLIVNNDINIIKNLDLDYEGKNIIEFTITFDKNTTDIQYHGRVFIDRINIYMKTGE